MPLSTYGQNYYASLIVGRETTIPPMYLALCTTVPTSASTGATIDEIPIPRMHLAPGTGTWSVPSNGVTEYLDSYQITANTADNWGTLVGYAICDTLAAGTGNVLFYGSMQAVTVDGTINLMYLDIQGIEVGVT